MAFDTELSKCKPTVDTWMKSEKLANPAEPSHCESCKMYGGHGKQVALTWHLIQNCLSVNKLSTPG